MTTRPTAPQTSSTPLQLSLVAAVPPSTDAPATADTRAWQIGLDHARYGLALPMAHLHTGSHRLRFHRCYRLQCPRFRPHSPSPRPSARWPCPLPHARK